MNRFLRLFMVALLTCAACLGAEQKASAQSAVTPSFRWLKQGEVKPAGWLKAQMERDLREGSIGHLDELAPQARSDIFVTGRNAPGRPNAYSQGGQSGEVESWGNGETEGNWWAGYIRTAYEVDDAQAKQKADAYVRHILQSQDKDGYIGIYSPEIRYSSSPEAGEVWTETTILRALLAYYDLTGDTEVLQAVERAAQLCISKYGPGKMGAFVPNYDCGVSHGLMFVDVVERLYDLTGNPAYRDFGLWLYQDFSAAKDWIQNGMNYWGDGKLPALLDLPKPMVGHGATTNEHIRVPVWAYIVSGNTDYRKAYENALVKVKRIELPSGATIAQEDSRGMKPDPTTNFYEFCALKELLMSYCSGLQKLGTSELGDRVEKLMFNAVQGSRAPGGMGVTYCTRDNRYSVDGAVGRRDKFSPTHTDVAVCCNPNFAQTAPEYIRGMWMKAPGDGLAALLYGPSSVETELKGTRVRIEEATEYPFSATVSLTVSPQEPVEFPLVLRNPGWSKSTRVTCKGSSITRKGDYFLVRKKWASGDQVKIVFSDPILRVRVWTGEVALQRGPLVYALVIPSVKSEIRSYNLHGFADLEYSSALGAKWWYALDPGLGKEDFGFVARAGKDANAPYPFEGAPVRLEGKMINLDNGRREDVSLVPMGSSLAMLRRVTFPVGRPEAEEK